MDLMNTPMNNISNKNEDLIQTKSNKQTNVDISQFFVPKNNHSGESFIIFFSNYGLIIPAVLFLIVCAIFGIFTPINIYPRIIAPSIAFIILFILLFLLIHKIILVKDIYNKKIQIKIVNYLCLPIKKINLEIENTHFYAGSMVHEPDEGPEYTTTRLFIINDYRNLLNIDSDERNIKKKPVECLYSFGSVKTGNHSLLEFYNILNDFVDSPRDYKNPFLFDINSYLKDKKKISNNHTGRKFLKYSDHFFSYHLKNLKNDIIKVIAKYMEIDTKNLDIQITQTESDNGKGYVPALVASIPIKEMKHGK